MRNPLVVLAPLALLLAACSPQPGEATSPEPNQPTSGSTSAPASGADREEQSHEAAVPRLVLSYDAGVMVLNADTMELVADVPLAGVTGVVPAEDGLHALVQTAQGNSVLFVGTWATAHGDHFHYFTTQPELESESAEVSAGTAVNENDGTRFDFAGKTVSAIDIETNEEWLSKEVPHQITGLAVFSGDALEGDSHGDDGNHDHDDHDLEH